MDIEEMHDKIFKGAVEIAAGGEEVAAIMFVYNEEIGIGVVPLGSTFNDKAQAAFIMRTITNESKATMVGFASEAWQAELEKIEEPVLDGPVKELPNSVEVLIITVETKDRSVMWSYPIHTDDAGQRVFDTEGKNPISDSDVEGRSSTNRFRVLFNA